MGMKFISYTVGLRYNGNESHQRSRRSQIQPPSRRRCRDLRGIPVKRRCAGGKQDYRQRFGITAARPVRLTASQALELNRSAR